MWLRYYEDGILYYATNQKSNPNRGGFFLRPNWRRHCCAIKKLETGLDRAGMALPTLDGLQRKQRYEARTMTCADTYRAGGVVASKVADHYYVHFF